MPSSSVRDALPVLARSLCAAAFLAAASLASQSGGEHRPAPTTRGAAREAARAGAVPRVGLVVVLAVDQMSPEQLERLRPWLSGGLRRFLDEGLVFRDAELRHGVTETAPGHASLGTGLDPTHHGIVANEWWVHGAKPKVYSVADPDVRALTGAGASTSPEYESSRLSPRNLRAPGIADFLRAADPASKSCSISSKDRAAVTLAGRRPDWALWWDRQRGGFMSSTWYGEQLPSWVRAWNEGWTRRLHERFGGGWQADFPPDFEASGTAADDRPGEAGLSGGRTFPHALPGAGEPETADPKRLAAGVYGSPAGDEFVLELAREACIALALGADEHVDLLAISLSSCDTVGHSFGPASREVSDVLLRADRELGELFELLDQRIGRQGYVAALSADHGVLELPEALQARGIGARRVPGRALTETVERAREALERRFGEDFYVAHDARGLVLARERIEALGLDAAEVRRSAARELAVAGSEWLEAAWTWEQLQAAARGPAPALGWIAAEARSFDEERSPDVTLLCKPWHLVGMSSGTSHGTPYPYDRRVPLAFLGAAFAPGESWEHAASVDVVPTLLASLGIEVPAGLDGRALAR